MANSYGATSVVSTAGGTAIIPTLTQRRSVLLKNNGSAIVYIGFDDSVTSSTGFPLMPQDTIEMSGNIITRGASIFGIAASGTQDVRYLLWDS